MKKCIPIVAMISFLCLGCGGGGGNSTSNTVSTPTTPSVPAITGNWSITATSVVSVGTVAVGGSLVSSGTEFLGVVHVLNSSCYNINTDVAVAGTITAGTNALTLTSAPIGGQVITVNGTISAAGNSLSAGTYTITGGCATGDHGSVTGFIAPAFTNTYSGSFTSISGPVITISVTTSQGAFPDADGLFHLTGTVTFQNSTCFNSGTITGSAVAGSFFQVTLTTNTGATVLFVGNITDSTGKTITGTYQVTGGICGGDSGNGSISHS